MLDFMLDLARFGTLMIIAFATYFLVLKTALMVKYERDQDMAPNVFVVILAVAFYLAAFGRTLPF